MAPKRSKAPTKQQVTAQAAFARGVKARSNALAISSQDSDSDGSNASDHTAPQAQTDVTAMKLEEIPEEIKEQSKAEAMKINNSYFLGKRFTIELDSDWDTILPARRRRRAPFMAKCNECAALIKPGKANMSQHYANQHRVEMTKPSASVAPGHITTEMIAIAQGLAGINDMQMETFIRVLNGAAHSTALPEVTRKGLVTARKVVCEKQLRFIAEKARDHKFVTVSFDGATIPHLGTHVMIIILYLGRAAYLLPPMYRENGATFSAQHYANALAKSLRLVHVNPLKVKWIVADGAKSNTCAYRGMMHALTEDLGESDDEAKEKERYDANEEPSTDEVSAIFAHIDAVGGIAKLIADDEALIAEVAEMSRDKDYRHATFIRCPPHIIKSWIERATPESWRKSRAYQLVTNFSYLMAKNGSIKKRFLTAIANAQSTMQSTTLESLAARLEQLIKVGNPMLRVAVWKKIRETFTDVSVNVPLARFNVEVNALAAATASTLPETEFETAKEMLKIVKKLVAEQSAPLATKNYTRYHNSTFGAYLFCKQNLDHIFASPEINTGKSTSQVKLRELKPYRDEIMEELCNYLTVFRPVADLMEAVSDASRHEPQAVNVYGFVQKCKVELTKIVDDCKAHRHDIPLNKLDGNVWKATTAEALLEQMLTDKPPWDFYEAVSVLEPSIGWATATSIDVAAQKTAIAELHQDVSDADKAKAVEDEVQRARLAAVKGYASLLCHDSSDALRTQLLDYLSACESLASHSALWWESKEAATRFPELAPLAKEIIWVPCAVTQCDSALSVASSLVKTNMARLGGPNFARRMMLQCNGDVTGSNDVAKTYFGDTIKKRLLLPDDGASPAPRTPRDPHK